MTIHELQENVWYELDGDEKHLYTKSNNEVYMCYKTELFIRNRLLMSWDEFHRARFTPYKQPYTPSEQEIQLFKLLPEWAKWIAVDDNGSVFIYQKEPKHNENYYFNGEICEYSKLKLFSHIIKLTFDDGPLNIEQYR